MPLAGFPSPEQFVHAWQKSSSLEEVSDRLVGSGHYRMTVAHASRWGSVLRQAGVRLKRMPRPVRLFRPPAACQRGGWLAVLRPAAVAVAFLFRVAGYQDGPNSDGVNFRMHCHVAEEKHAAPRASTLAPPGSA